MADHPETTAPSRGERRRAQTRASLIDAARQLIGERGIEGIRIGDITERADVGFGSFYNHFTDKDEVIQAVLRETIAAQASAVESFTANIEDPAEVVAVAHRHFVDLAVTDPTWAWVIVRLDVAHQLLTAALGPYAVRDLEAGIAVGRFAVADQRVTLNATGGALVAVMRDILEHGPIADADAFHAELVLRMLGLSAADAAEVARRPLPDGSKND